jgi:hypothetical protein
MVDWGARGTRAEAIDTQKMNIEHRTSNIEHRIKTKIPYRGQKRHRSLTAPAGFVALGAKRNPCNKKAAAGNTTGSCLPGLSPGAFVTGGLSEIGSGFSFDFYPDILPELLFVYFPHGG